MSHATICTSARTRARSCGSAGSSGGSGRVSIRDTPSGPPTGSACALRRSAPAPIRCGYDGLEFRLAMRPAGQVHRHRIVVQTLQALHAIRRRYAAKVREIRCRPAWISLRAGAPRARRHVAAPVLVPRRKAPQIHRRTGPQPTRFLPVAHLYRRNRAPLRHVRRCNPDSLSLTLLQRLDSVCACGAAFSPGVQDSEGLLAMVVHGRAPFIGDSWLAGRRGPRCIRRIAAGGSRRALRGRRLRRGTSPSTLW